MTIQSLKAAALGLVLIAVTTPARAQTFRTDDSTIRRIWALGMDSSQTERLSQALFDSIGMRLSGTTGFQSAVEWLEARYAALGVTARREQYATTRGWRMGPVSMALLSPHVQTLETHLLASSPGTGNRPVEGDAVIVP